MSERVCIVTSVVINGDSRKILQNLADKSVHMMVTSPPYYGLRKYGTPPQTWGGDPNCQHLFEDVHPPGYRGSDTNPGPLQHEGNKNREDDLTSQTCSKCGAWCGELGLEPTPEMYIEHLTEIFREARRVLRDDGTLWVNIGDSYARNPAKGGSGTPTGRNNRGEEYSPVAPIHPSYKEKDLMEIPSMLAASLRADGWYLRSRLPWIKRNALPSSVKDRPSSSIEYVFLFSKSKTYYYDYVATMQKSSESYNKDKRPRGQLTQRVGKDRKYPEGDPDYSQFRKQDGTGNPTVTGFNARYKAAKERAEEFDGKNIACDAQDAGRRALMNIKMARESSGSHDQPFGALRYMRDSDFFFRTWQGLLHNEDGEPMALVVNPKGYKGAHFACFPVKLVEPLILASTSEKGVCPDCGAPWVRVETTTGFFPSCTCHNNIPIPATILDMFAGSCATGVACGLHNRDFIGIDLKPDYCDLGKKRLVEGK